MGERLIRNGDLVRVWPGVVNDEWLAEFGNRLWPISALAAVIRPIPGGYVQERRGHVVVMLTERLSLGRRARRPSLIVSSEGEQLLKAKAGHVVLVPIDHITDTMGHHLTFTGYDPN